MTRDEIMQMEAGSEMDVLIAKKVMHWYSDPDVPYYDSVEADGVIHISRKWSPSTDIASAWEVVEKLKSDGHELYISTTYGQFDCTIVDDNGEPDENHSLTMLGAAHEETAPLAICRAALLMNC